MFTGSDVPRRNNKSAIPVKMFVGILHTAPFQRAVLLFIKESLVMQNEMQVFQNEQFGEIRAFEIGGEHWFVGKDIAEVLAYHNTRDALKKHVDSEDKADVAIHDGRQNRKMTVINESGIYSLIFSSKLPAAKTFKRWVTSEVLPSIRKNGAYINEQLLEELLESRETADEFFKQLKEEKKLVRASNRLIKTQSKLIGELEDRLDDVLPEAEYCENVLLCENAIPVSIIAKSYGMTAQKFNQLLHRIKIHYKVGGVWVLYSRYDGNGYTATRTYEKDGKAIVNTVWTQLGREFLYRKLAENGYFPEYEQYEDEYFKLSFECDFYE